MMIPYPHRRCFYFALLTVLGFHQICAQEPSYKLTVRAERETAIYEKGEKIIFHVQLTEAGKPLADKNLKYVISADGTHPQSGELKSTDAVAVIETALDKPGFVRCQVSWPDAPGKTITAVGGAGVAPLEIKSSIPEPENFDAFWNAQKEALADHWRDEMKPMPAEKINDPKIEVFDVTVTGPDGPVMTGYFAKPKDAQPKSLPIVISYQSAGVKSAKMPIREAKRRVLALDVNAHGLENGQPTEYYKNLYAGELKSYFLTGPATNAADIEKNYFIGMYRRVYRSLQFMKARPEWDGKTIVVFGTSQGGGQALVAAGLDSRVSFCAAFVPALCYPLGSLEGNSDGWPGFLRNKTAENADPALVKTVTYIDAALFAKRIKAESVLSTGFVDATCSPTSVYVAYNNITAPKQIFPTPETDHATPPATYAAVFKLLWDYVERNRVKAE